MARKKKEPEQNKLKVNTDGIMGLVGSTTEQPISENGAKYLELADIS